MADRLHEEHKWPLEWCLHAVLISESQLNAEGDDEEGFKCGGNRVSKEIQSTTFHSTSIRKQSWISYAIDWLLKNAPPVT
jgi:hypothetical protein